MLRCPECKSDDVIEWDDGYICRDCGCEFDDPDDRPVTKHQNEEE